MTIIDEYLAYQEKYVKKYGQKTVVFEMIGSFYEAYATNTRGYKLAEVAEKLNLILTRKDKKIDKIDEKNPLMLGFPAVAIEKYLKLLVDDGFTVVIVDQVTPPPNPKRKVTGVYSPGTYIHEHMNQDSNNIVSLFIEDEIQKDGSVLMCIGMSVIDLSTGENTVHESYSLNGDEKYALDEAVRFITSYNPKETLIYRKNNSSKMSMTMDAMILYLELESKIYHYYTDINKHFFKISYQNEFLRKIFPDTGMLTPIEYLDLEKLPYAIISLITILDYSYQHNEKIISHIYKTKIFNNNQHLILGNNAVFQLNVFENNALEVISNTKYKSLFDVVNNTSTAMGRRHLRKMLVAPLTSAEDIESIYSCIESMIKDNLFSKVENNLKFILDLERLHRKLMLSIIQPYEFAGLIESYKHVTIIIKTLSKIKSFKNMFPDKVILSKFDELIKDIEYKFNFDELKKNNFTDIISSFFNVGINKDIDNLELKINGNLSFMQNVCKILSDRIEDVGKAKFKKKNNSDDDDKIYLKKNDRDGYYMSLTKLRAKSLQKNLVNIKTIKITENYYLDPKKLIFKDLPKGNTKLFIDDLSTKSNDTFTLKDQLTTIVIDFYKEIIEEYKNKYFDVFKKITQFIAFIDFIKSNAKTAKLYNYIRPKIVKTNKDTQSYIKCAGLRHPIVERIRTDCEYVPHDVCLGKIDANELESLDGMLIYGLNSSGKSSLMKAVGISIIMAQCGMFVPATNYQFYPYHALYARITGTDNIFKGLSSFALEMTELRAILKRAGPHTLVIGDELTKGTEHTSGNAIVAAVIIQLSRSKSTFIFATHLHDIAKMDRIKELKNVKCFHLSVEYDKDKDLLIFDRKLKPGSGDEIYGLTFAKYIIHDNDFLKLSQEIMNEMLNKPKHIIADKISRYNSKIYMYECQLCGKKIDNKDSNCNLDSHHINFQKDCNKDNFIINKPHIKKNAGSNIVVICKSCHHQIHDDKSINIEGYVDTSKGKKLVVNKKIKH